MQQRILRDPRQSELMKGGGTNDPLRDAWCGNQMMVPGRVSCPSGGGGGWM